MKKVLSVFSLLALLSLAMPANAAPPPPAGGPMGGQVVQAGPGFRGHGGPHKDDWGTPPPPHRAYYERGSVVVGGVLARRSYWGYPYSYGCRLGWCDDFYPPHPPIYRPSGVYINLGVPIRF